MLCDIDMIFNEDAILLQLFNIIEDEDELKEAVLKYCNGGIMEISRPAVIDASQGDLTELEQVRRVLMKRCNEWECLDRMGILSGNYYKRTSKRIPLYIIPIKSLPLYSTFLLVIPILY